MKLAVSLLVAFLVALVVALVYRGNALDARADLRTAESDLEFTKVELVKSERRRDAEQRRAQRMYELAAEYEQERKDAEAVDDRTIADLRAGNLRMQERWAGCPTPRLPGLDPATGEPDAAPDDRAESAGRIVRAAAECDAQVRGLQRVIREYLGHAGE